MNWFTKFFSKKESNKKTSKTEKPTQVKSWWSKNHKDHYCKWIEGGKEAYGVITGCYYKRFSDGSTTKELHIAGESRVDSDKVVILGRKVDEITRLRCEVYRLRKKTKKRDKTFRELQKRYEKEMSRYYKYSAEMHEARKQMLSKDELKRYLELTLESPVLSLTSNDVKERETAGVLMNEFTKRNIKI